jgi:hypothetical protein
VPSHLRIEPDQPSGRGTTRTWTGRGAPGYWPGVPAWAGDGTVVVPWWHDTGHGMLPAAISGVRDLDLAAPGGSLADPD